MKSEGKRPVGRQETQMGSVFGKVSTVYEYFRRSAEVVISRMRAVFPDSLRSHRRRYEKADSVYVLFCAFKMFKMIERPADCDGETGSYSSSDT
jgi:hypothetical protein